MAKSNKGAAQAAPNSTEEKKARAPFVEKIKTPVGLLIKNIGLAVTAVVCAAEKDKDARKKLNNKVAPKWSNKTLSSLVIKASGEDYDTLKKLAKAAAQDAEDGKRTAAVNAMWDFMANYGGDGVRSSRQRVGLGSGAAQLL